MRAVFGVLLILLGLAIGVMGYATHQRASAILGQYQSIGQTAGGLVGFAMQVVPQTRAAIEQAYAAQTVGVAGMAAGAVFTLAGLLLAAIPVPAPSVPQKPTQIASYSYTSNPHSAPQPSMVVPVPWRSVLWVFLAPAVFFVSLALIAYVLVYR